MLGIEADGCAALPNTGRIDPVGFRIVLLTAIKLCAFACADFERQACELEPFKQSPACCIDRCGVLEGLLGLRLDVGMPKLSSSLCTFLLIAGVAGHCQIAHTIRPAACFRNDVLNLKGKVFRTTVGTLRPPLLQQIFAHLIAV